jgi:arylsulfatase A-like enzyme
MPASRRLVAACALFLLAACNRQPESGRVVVLALDGVDPDVVELLVEEGRLPSFRRLRLEGASGRLWADEPLLSPVLWTTIATGRSPGDHGIGHFTAVDEASGASLPVTSSLRRVPAVWTFASEAGKEVSVVGWWATWPAEQVEGTLVSDHVCYHFLFEDGFDGPPRESAGNTWPREFEAEIAPLIRRPAELEAADLAPFVSVAAEELARPFSFDDELQHFRWALATARSYQAVGLHAWRTRAPSLQMVYVEGVDSTSHLFGHLWRVEGLHGALSEQQQRYGRTVEAMYEEVDRYVGEWLEEIDEDTTLVVLSDHGFELGRLHDDPTRSADMRRVSEHFHEPEGIVYLHGRGVRPGSRLSAARQLDITPTLLALLGLPATESMPGRVLTEGLDLGELPPRVSDSGWTPQGAGAPDADADPAILEHLQSLGYVSASSPKSDRTLAVLLFQEGRHAEAEAAFRSLLAEQPDDAALLVNLAAALGAQDRDAEAWEALARAIALEPLMPEAHHDRAVLLERGGRASEAVEDYRRALRYAPHHEPSREALLRLTGSADVHRLEGGPEREAAALAERAREFALRGDYAAAAEALDEAEVRAPGLALVHQYRSNVAWLSGDSEAAISALERALELEPDNALYRVNLETLRARAVVNEGGGR